MQLLIIWAIVAGCSCHGDSWDEQDGPLCLGWSCLTRSWNLEDLELDNYLKVAEMFDKMLFGMSDGGNLMSLYAENDEVVIKHRFFMFAVI
jgi:hypothetical protein